MAIAYAPVASMRRRRRSDLGRTALSRWLRASTLALALAGAAAVIPVATPAMAAADGAVGKVCRDVTVPVALGPGRPTDQQLYGRLCEPTSGGNGNVQVLLHAFTYTHSYWDYPDLAHATADYSYADHAALRGFATLALDRIGNGRSSKPVGPEIGVLSNAHTVGQVLQGIRAGTIADRAQHRFNKITLVGNSLGSLVAEYTATLYPREVDALVATSATHNLNTSVVPPFATGLVPAQIEPKFAHAGLDPTYLSTTSAQARRAVFYGDAPVTDQQLTLDNDTRGTATVTELVDVVRSVNGGGSTLLGNLPARLLGADAVQSLAALPPLDIRVPTLVVEGSRDTSFCRIPGQLPGGSDCSSGPALAKDEAPYLGRRVPSVDGYVQPGAGHNLNNTPSAPQYLSAVQNWISHTLQ